MDDCEPEDKYRRNTSDSLLREIAFALSAEEGRKTPLSREFARQLIEKALVNFRAAATRIDRRGAWVVRRMPDLEIVAVAFDEAKALQQLEAVRVATGQGYVLRKEGSDGALVWTAPGE